MKCPTCNCSMGRMGCQLAECTGSWFCPLCGTLKVGHDDGQFDIIVPALVGKVRDFGDTLVGRYSMADAMEKLRKQKIRAAGHKCQRCKSRDKLQVHHKHYRSLGKERNGDLEVVCRPCHQKEHEGWIAAKDHMDAISKRQG